MKIEIDLNDILGDERGAETLQDSIRRQVIEHLSEKTRDGVMKQIREETARVINETLQAAVVEKMPGIVADLLDKEYTPVDRYGNPRREGPTTFRAELLAKIVAEMEYEPAKDGYNRDRENVFTKAVRGVVTEKLTAFKTSFDKNVDTNFIHHALEYATTKLRERMGIKP